MKSYFERLEEILRKNCWDSAHESPYCPPCPSCNDNKQAILKLIEESIGDGKSLSDDHTTSGWHKQFGWNANRTELLTRWGIMGD